MASPRQLLPKGDAASVAEVLEAGVITSDVCHGQFDLFINWVCVKSGGTHKSDGFVAGFPPQQKNTPNWPGLRDEQTSRDNLLPALPTSKRANGCGTGSVMLMWGCIQKPWSSDV